ncbi:MAG TPA: pantoate--beta-alanine ligase [Candidatus Binatia bacterium]
MQIIEKVSAMQSWSEIQRCAGRRIAFVPTMGFLHEGHLSLVRHARSRGDRVVVSVFVNPAQFAPQEDFAAYPRDFERDRKLLDNEAVDILFSPAVQEMYPQQFQTRVEVSQLSKLLCGAHRQDHFQGVATVVAKLFNAVRPHVAIFGEKDYQQLQVIRSLVRDLNFDIEIAGHPIVREADGLAMSSRNAYLSGEERKAALCLFRSLKRAASMVQTGEAGAREITEAVKAEVAREPLARLEYVKLCDTINLTEVDEVQDRALLALAVRIGRTRLIDNTILTR